MTQDEIIALAVEAGFEEGWVEVCNVREELTNLYNLGRAHEREKLKSTYEQMNFDARVEATEPFVNWREKTQKITTDYEIHLKASILAEREACAKVCEDLYKHLNHDADCRKLWPHTKMINDQYAAAIRARGEK